MSGRITTLEDIRNWLEKMPDESLSLPVLLSGFTPDGKEFCVPLKDIHLAFKPTAIVFAGEPDIGKSPCDDLTQIKDLTG